MSPRWLIAFACLALPVYAQSTLERVVLVQRHGVRSPTKAPQALAAYADAPWPEWPVAPGILTDHGADNVALLGAWLRAHYSAAGLLPAAGCPATGTVKVWADGADQRTRVSGQKFLDGAFPGCGLTAASGPAGAADPIFAPIEAGVTKIDASQEAAALQAALPPADAAEHAAERRLQAVLFAIPSACTSDTGSCFLQGADRVKITAKGAKLAGPLATGSTLAENLMLEYTQGMSGAQLGWGRLDPAALAQIMLLHNRAEHVEDANPYMAPRNGGMLARAIATALAGQGGYQNTRLVLFAGHDTNLANLAGILGLDWQLPAQVDATPPGGTLAFELWRSATGREFTKLVLYYATTGQLRAGTLAGGARSLLLATVPNINARLLAPLPAG